MRPNFLVIGAQKCATSTLCELLADHPQVFVSNPKEPFYFSHSDVWRRGWSWYESLFKEAEGKKAIGEGSTTYTQHGLYPDAPERIAKHLPDVRLIYIVRDPLERIESHWMHNRSKGNRETRPFNEAVRENPEYMDHSRYDYQLEFYRRRFPDDRILVLFFEDLRDDPHTVIRKCFGFLGVDITVPIKVAGRQRHESSEGRVDRWPVRIMRWVPWFSVLRDRSPTMFREAMRQIFKTPIGDRPEWLPETKQWVLDQIDNDNRVFLGQYGHRGSS